MAAARHACARSDCERRVHPDGLRFVAWPAPDGWPLRRFDWRADDPIGSLLFLGGRGDFVEKYLEAIVHWRSRGWSVSGFDWRGQGGSGRLHRDPTICHLDSFDPLLDDLAAVVADWSTASPGPHMIVAHSMGAHLALRLLAERGARLDGAALLSPMVGIAAAGLPLAGLRLISAGAIGLGLGGRRLWSRDPGNVGDRLTACPDRQADKLWWKATYPEIASGAPSWRWLNAAARSIASLDRAPGLTRIATPLLLLSAERDAIVDVAAMRALVRRLPDATLTLLPGRGHELLREADAQRGRVMTAIDAFLDGAKNRVAAV